MLKKIIIKIYVQNFEQLENAIKKIEDLQKKHKNIKVSIELN